MKGEDISNTGVKNYIFIYSFSEALSDIPTSEMLPYMQGAALLLLLLVSSQRTAELLALGNATGCCHPCDGSSAVRAGQTFAFQ